MSHYKHLTIVERERLDHLRAEGKSITCIAELLGRNKSTISRELRRNTPKGEYIPYQAQTMYHERRKACRPIKRLADSALFAFVSDKFLKSAKPVARAIIEALQEQPAYTITPDRGKEFALHNQVTEALDIPFYFPKPHQPWQRGTNENNNGLLREYYPKGTSFYGVTNESLQVVVDKLNSRPRKCLDWQTPHEVYFNTVLHLT